MSHNFYTAAAYNNIFLFDHDHEITESHTSEKTFYTNKKLYKFIDFDLYQNFRDLFFRDLNKMLAQNMEEFLRNDEFSINENLLFFLQKVNLDSEDNVEESVYSLFENILFFLRKNTSVEDFDFESILVKKNVLEIQIEPFEEQRNSLFKEAARFFLKKINIVFNFQEKKTPLFLINTKKNIDLCIQGFVDDNTVFYNFVYKNLSRKDTFEVPKLPVSSGYRPMIFFSEVQLLIPVFVKNGDLGIKYKKPKRKNTNFQKFVENPENSDGQINTIVELVVSKKENEELYDAPATVTYNQNFILLKLKDPPLGIKFNIKFTDYTKEVLGTSNYNSLIFTN